MAVLWSEFLALWFDRTRRRAVPLLLATLLLLIPSLPARSDCSCGMPGQHHHEMAHCPDGDGDDHDEDEAHEHHEMGAAARSASARTGQAHFVAGNVAATSRTMTACCSCSRAPLTAAVVAAPVPSPVHADGQSLVTVRADATPVFRFDSLAGLFGRAGPPPDSKPKLLFLASLAGRAPPVSL